MNLNRTEMGIDYLLNDGQAESGSLELARHRSSRLNVRIENVSLIFFGNADSGVAHEDAQEAHGVALFQTLHADDDFTSLGELDRIAD